MDMFDIIEIMLFILWISSKGMMQAFFAILFSIWFIINLATYNIDGDDDDE